MPKQLNEIEKFFIQIKNLNYVVMRWFNKLPKKLYDTRHDDIDILITDEEASLVQHTSFCQANDVRKVSCNYFPREKAKEMIETSIDYKGVKVPNSKFHFLSFAYHILYHKFLDGGVPTKIEPFAAEYLRRGTNRYPEYYKEVKKLARKLGYKESITLENLHKILKNEGWTPCLNAPSGVIHDINLLQQFIERIDNGPKTA